MANPFQEVLDFWFGPELDETAIPKEKAEMWFKNGQDYDEIIKQKFLSLHTKAANGELDRWARRGKSCLALVLLLDQFSRHIYRHQAQSFTQDAQAIMHTQKAIASGVDQELLLIERSFLYMPLMHAEDAKIQELSVKMFSKLVEQAPALQKPTYHNSLSFAESHQYVIGRFGRFPELNEILDRESTELEKSFLSTGKYRFL